MSGCVRVKPTSSQNNTENNYITGLNLPRSDRCFEQFLRFSTHTYTHKHTRTHTLSLSLSHTHTHTATCSPLTTPSMKKTKPKKKQTTKNRPSPFCFILQITSTRDKRAIIRAKTKRLGGREVRSVRVQSVPSREETNQQINFKV